MGSLSNFNDTCLGISELKRMFGLNVFVETGCFRGNTLRYVTRFGFDRLYSCDIDEDMIRECKNIASNLELFHCTSTEFLETILPRLDGDQVLFFLDAHLPEHDKNNGEKITASNLNFPLEKELQLINKFRSGKKDVIICDDLRIYEDGPFEGGNWEKRKDFEGLDLRFLSRYNYKVKKFYKQEGYILLT